MKNFLVISVLLLAGCNRAPAVPEPVPAVPVGFTFNTPCMMHGEDVWTVTSVERTFVYKFTNTEGTEASTDEAGLLEAFKELGISLDTK